jgi:uncharacterized membrane protein
MQENMEKNNMVKRLKDQLSYLKDTEGKELDVMEHDLENKRKKIERVKILQDKKRELGSLRKKLNQIKSVEGEELDNMSKMLVDLENKIKTETEKHLKDVVVDGINDTPKGEETIPSSDVVNKKTEEPVSGQVPESLLVLGLEPKPEVNPEGEKVETEIIPVSELVPKKEEESENGKGEVEEDKKESTRETSQMNSSGLSEGQKGSILGILTNKKDGIIVDEKREDEKKEDGEIKAEDTNESGLTKEQKNSIFGILEDKGGKESKVSKDDILNKEKANEAENKVEDLRTKFLEEYTKCKKESDKQNIISKAKNAILNIFRSKENRVHAKPEDFFTEDTIKAKKEYDEARINMGNAMYEERKTELEKAGLSGDDLEKALKEYKATEILAKTIIDERQKVIDGKVKGVPIKPALWKKLIDGYIGLKPRWKKVAVSTLLFTAAAGLGITTGGVFAGYGLASMAAMKFGTSMALGSFVGYSVKGVDLIARKSDKRFADNIENEKQNWKDKFGRGEINQEEYEKGIENIENKEKKRARNRVLLKAGVGIALAGSAGFLAYDALGHGLSPTDTTSGVDLNHVNTNNILTPHANIEAVADHGQGAISTLKELQHNLKVEYGDNLDNAPASVKHILNTDANKLAEEYGMYKPGQDAESMLIKSGSSFRVDESGNVSYNEAGGNDTILVKGLDTKADNVYEGKMIDTDNSGLKVDPVQTNKIPNGDILDKKFETEGSPTITEINTSDIANNEIIVTYDHNINHLFPDNDIKIWDDVKNISAEKFIKIYEEGSMRDIYNPLVSYVQKLEEVSGLKPNTETLISPAESISQFISRALNKIQEADQLDKVTL